MALPTLCRAGPRLALVPALVLAPLSLAAQLPAGDSAWRAGRFAEARAAYERVLAADSLDATANLRIGILLSWAGKLDSAAALIGRARRAAPQDADLQMAEARIHAWQGRYDLAIAQYDSVLRRYPADHDAALGRALTLAWASRYSEADAAYRALLTRDPADTAALTGRARLAAWSGNTAAARRQYEAALASDPRNADALTGLAQLDHWQGHDRRARTELDSALSIAPSHPQALELRREVRAVLRPRADVSFAWGHDSDRNETFAESGTFSGALGDALRGFATVGFLQANDPGISATRTSGEAGLTYARDRWRATGAVGVGRLAPSGLGSRTELSARGGVGYRVTPRVSVGLGYSWAPFAETAALIAQRLDLGTLDASAGLHAGDHVDLALEGALGWLSDGNARRDLAGTATVTLPRHFFVGALGRTLSYDRAGVGYFSPAPFTTVEAQGGWARDGGAVALRVSGGFGVQQIGAGSDRSEWHGELRATRRWGSANELAVYGGITNSAAASTTGAFRSGTAGLAVRLGV